MNNLNINMQEQFPNDFIMQQIEQGHIHIDAAAIFQNHVLNPADLIQPMPNQPINIQLNVIPEEDEDATVWKVSKMVETIR